MYKYIGIFVVFDKSTYIKTMPKLSSKSSTVNCDFVINTWVFRKSETYVAANSGSLGRQSLRNDRAHDYKLKYHVRGFLEACSWPCQWSSRYGLRIIYTSVESKGSTQSHSTLILSLAFMQSSYSRCLAQEQGNSTYVILKHAYKLFTERILVRFHSAIHFFSLDN